jgi:hypothetical protein
VGGNWKVNGKNTGDPENYFLWPSWRVISVGGMGLEGLRVGRSRNPDWAIGNT